MIRFNTGNTGSFLKQSSLEKAVARGTEELESLLSRSGPGADMLGWLDLHEISQRDLSLITNTAKRIQDESDLLVVVGIGGSYLGGRALIEALPDEAAFPVLFAGNNLSPDHHARLLDSLEGKRFSVCVISKSGTTTESAIAFRILESELLKRRGKMDARRLIIAVTDPDGGALRQLAEKEGYITFPIPPNVGGRFSVLSSAGLFPSAVAGIPAERLLKGAGEAMDRYTKTSGGNDAVEYAARRLLFFEGGYSTEILSAFHPELGMLCEWWKQLAGESEGKKHKGLFPASAIMTTDLHSLGQYLQEGPRNIIETFLIASAPRREIEVPSRADDLDGLNYLAGRAMSDISRMAYEGTQQAHQAGGLPVLSIELPMITPESLGALIVFFEISIAVSGRLLGVNPFDQPGVDEYKRRMFRLLGKPGIEQ
ncbi:MAG: glucose-6-phosphate isomerase [Candidatus Krumholzibacteria bacterium]|nr:glucose-6-phosphate isomerase [Candidatus Krumholzibacteria bacterium]